MAYSIHSIALNDKNVLNLYSLICPSCLTVNMQINVEEFHRAKNTIWYVVCVPCTINNVN